MDLRENPGVNTVTATLKLPGLTIKKEDVQVPLHNSLAIDDFGGKQSLVMRMDTPFATGGLGSVLSRTIPQGIKVSKMMHLVNKLDG